MITKGYKISLKALRINADYSLEEVAALLSVSEQDVMAWEANASVPDHEQAKKLAALYNVEYQDLFYGKFKSAKEVFFHNREMLKKAQPGDKVKLSDDGEIIGFYKQA